MLVPRATPSRCPFRLAAVRHPQRFDGTATSGVIDGQKVWTRPWTHVPTGASYWPGPTRADGTPGVSLPALPMRQGRHRGPPDPQGPAPPRSRGLLHPPGATDSEPGVGEAATAAGRAGTLARGGRGQLGQPVGFARELAADGRVAGAHGAMADPALRDGCQGQDRLEVCRSKAPDATLGPGDENGSAASGSQAGWASWHRGPGGAGDGSAGAGSSSPGGEPYDWSRLAARSLAGRTPAKGLRSRGAEKYRRGGARRQKPAALDSDTLVRNRRRAVQSRHPRSR